MTLTGPQKIPFADHSKAWYGSKYPGDAMESNVGVIHTTEGTTLPGYGGGVSAPNVTGVPDIKSQRINWFQHFDVDRSSRALVNKSGGVETNTLNAFQVELVGTCDPAKKTSWGSKKAGVDYIFWPAAPDWALREVGKLVKWLADNHKIPAKSGVVWKAYPSSYGNTVVRLTGAQWGNYYGWLGHQHVPENDHGDPGNLNFARVLEHAAGSTGPAPAPKPPAPSKPRYQPYPGAAFFKNDPTSPIVTAMGRRLVAEGCSRYKVGPGPDWSSADKASYAAWQRKLGYTGADADGWPGKTSWDKLKVPFVK